MFFANLLVLFGRRSLFGSLVLGLKIVLADLACPSIFGGDTLGSLRASTALRGAKVVAPREVFAVAIAGARRFAVRTTQFIARFVEVKVFQLIQLRRG